MKVMYNRFLARPNTSPSIHRFATLKVLHAARDSQKHITDIKWAPGGQSLAIGAADGKIYVYRRGTLGVTA